MSEKITISDLSIAGFRAFLKPQPFHLRRNNQPLSLAVFAPNAKGKSSLVDALEFFFSTDGTIKRLGIRRSGTQAGREALEHIKAQEIGVTSQIYIKFEARSDSFEGTRNVDQCESIPDAARRVICARKLDFIIRGYELRHFVESQPPLERYQEISNWFGLSSLSAIEHNLRDLRLSLNAEFERDAQAETHRKELQRITGQGLSTWDEAQVLAWFNMSHLSLIDPTLAIDTLGKESPIYKTIDERKRKEDENVGLAALTEVVDKVQTIYLKQEVNGSILETGTVINFESAVEAAVQADSREQEERAKSEKAVFREVWEAASNVFKDVSVDISVCPVCDTPLEQTTKGSRKSIEFHLDTQLADLTSYSETVIALRSVSASAKQKHGLTLTSLKTLQAALRSANFGSDAKAMEAYIGAIESWTPEKEPPNSISIKGLLSKIKELAESERQRIENNQCKNTYRECLSKLDELINLKLDVDTNIRIRSQMQILLGSLTEMERTVGSRIRAHIQSVIDKLKDNVNTLYGAVHADETEAPVIRLELPPDTKKPQLNLLTNFALNRQGVVPSGYFSDSQVHTLALSLRLAAIQILNTQVPIVILDDVVTSYDAEHRKAIAAMLAKYFANFQVILVTHDERFFVYLKDHLPGSSWVFKRIKTLDKDYGPRFHDHVIADDVIDQKLNNGESAANDIRQAEEEWLLTICRDFRLEVEIRSVHKPYSYDRSELAIALYKFLKDRKIAIPNVPGVSNPFLLSLQKGDVENFGSHFSDDPSAWASLGDEQLRWKEFKYFRGLFVCQNCGSTRFKRPKGMDMPVCIKGVCETLFYFKTVD